MDKSSSYVERLSLMRVKKNRYGSEASSLAFTDPLQGVFSKYSFRYSSKLAPMSNSAVCSAGPGRHSFPSSVWFFSFPHPAT